MTRQSDHIQIRISREDKKAAQDVLDRLGMSFSEGIKLFLTRMVEEQGMPFATSKPRPNAAKAPSSPEKPSAPANNVQPCNLFTKRKIG